MSDTPPSSVLGSLPTSRPQRRSDKRVARPAAPAGSEAAAKDTPKLPAKRRPAAKPRPAAKTGAKPKTPAPARPIAAASPSVAAKPRATAKAQANAKPAAAAKPRAAANPTAAAKPRAAKRRAPVLKAVPPPKTRSRPEPPPRPGTPRPVRPTPSIDLTDIAGTAIKAAAELAEIGLSASARALKLAVSRLPRP